MERREGKRHEKGSKGGVREDVDTEDYENTDERQVFFSSFSSMN